MYVFISLSTPPAVNECGTPRVWFQSAHPRLLVSCCFYSPYRAQGLSDCEVATTMDAEDALKALAAVRLARDHAARGQHGAATAILMQVSLQSHSNLMRACSPFARLLHEVREVSTCWMGSMAITWTHTICCSGVILQAVSRPIRVSINKVQ